MSKGVFNKVALHLYSNQLRHFSKVVPLRIIQCISSGYKLSTRTQNSEADPGLLQHPRWSAL